jgi:hypothetical protein
MVTKAFVPCMVLGLVLTGCVTSPAGRSAGGKPMYTVKHTLQPPPLDNQWDSPAWRAADTLKVTHFAWPRPGNEHRPVTEARVLYDDAGLYLHFRVQDKFVRCIETEYHGKVWEDAAVEFFVQPKPERGYLNFEINCGGTMLLSYHENPDYQGPPNRAPGRVPWDLASNVAIYHSMPKVVDPEITDDVTWHIAFFIPYPLLEEYVGPLGNVAGQQWRANFYKIAENNSHPHYAAWSPILEGATFHAPRFFGRIQFAR